MSSIFRGKNKKNVDDNELVQFKYFRDKLNGIF